MTGVMGLDTRQHTLKQSLSFVGIGMHTGRKVSVVIKPAPEDTGIYFLRKDVPFGEGLLPAHWYNIVNTELCTTLGTSNGITLATVEHLLAALRGCGIDNAIIEVDGPELPIMDGSAAPFVTQITQYGRVRQSVERQIIWILRPIEVQQNTGFAVLMPSTAPKITASIDFGGTAVGCQTYTLTFSEQSFASEVADARTFGFSAQVTAMRQRGLIRGASIKNAVLVDGYQIVNPEGLRHTDEFARHKALDCLGDLSLAGHLVMGHLYAYRPGHTLNRSLLEALFSQRNKWSYLSLRDYRELYREACSKAAFASDYKMPGVASDSQSYPAAG